MSTATEPRTSGAAGCCDQSPKSSREPSVHTDLTKDTPQHSLGTSENDCHDELQGRGFTFYMSQIPFSEYNTQKSRLFPSLEELIAQVGPCGGLANMDRTTHFSQAILPSQDYESAIRCIERIFRYISDTMTRINGTREADDLTLLLKCLADASRIETWRLPLGAFGLVSTCLDLLATNENANSSWPAHALRLLSNCCVDPIGAGSADPNIKTIQSRIDLKSILPLLRAQETHKPCLFFVYQLSIDDVRFQERLVTHDLLLYLVGLLGSEWVCDDQALDRTCDIFQWPACEASLLSQGSKALVVLLRASQICHISTEVNASLTILISTLLGKTEIKIADGQVSEVLLFFQLNRPIDSKQTSGLSISDDLSASDGDTDSNDSEEKDHRQTLLNARKHLTNTLGQLATRADFVESISSKSKTFSLLWKWLSSTEADFQICALLMIGNMAFGSERRNVELVEQGDIVPQLVRILEHGSNGLVLQSAFEVVQIFSQSPHTRLAFGRHGILEAMSRSWQQSTDTQLRISALHHTRQVLHECLGNIYRFVDETPQHSAQSLLHRMMALFREAEIPDVRLQCGLIVVEIWHTYLAKSHDNSASLADSNLSYSAISKGPEGSILKAESDPKRQMEPLDTRDSDFSLLKYAMIDMCQVHSDIIKPFLAVIDSKNPSLATRTWLTLALMSKEPCCADVLYGTLIDGDGSAVFRATLVDQEKAKPKEASNARFLLYELKQRYVADVKRTTVLSSLWQTLA